MVRLIDVAKKAGVSHGTASNVFNNPKIVRKELREQVEAAARELGYAGPDPKGRLLRGGRYRALAVMPPLEGGIFDTLRNPVYAQFLQGVAEACDDNQATLVIASGKVGAPGVSDVLVDGAIFARVEQLAELDQVRLRQMPFAVVDCNPGPGINAVIVDARAGGHSAARHLLDLGHRNFAIMAFMRSSGPPILHAAGLPRAPDAAGIAIDQDKYQGYAEALAAVGINIADVPMVQADVFDATAPAMLLDAAPEATAILSMSVMQALGVIGEARQRGLSVPGDLSVVGYNDIPEAALSDPPLTTVDSMTRQKGRQAADLVFSGEPPRHEIIKPQLILRNSTAPPKVRQV